MALQNAAADRLEELLELLGVDGLRRAKKFYVGCCPVHGGDRNSAFNIFHSGDTCSGNWRCFTHGCHKEFQPSLVGFVRGVISHRKYGWRNTGDTDKMCPFKEVVEFMTKFVGNDFSDMEINLADIEKRKFTSRMEKVYNRKKPVRKIKIPRELVRQSLEIPDQYFITREYSPALLDRYDVGLCTNPNREMYMRATAPIYDEARPSVRIRG